MRPQAASFQFGAVLEGGRALVPGLLACGVIAAASAFLAQHYGAPVMLFALLLGMAMNFLSGEGACKPGIDFAARQVLRVGIALLGLRITAGQVAALGWEPSLLVVGELASQAVAEAVLRAVREASGVEGVPSVRDIAPSSAPK